MASVFRNALNFLGGTFKQIATNDNLRDYRHASKLFIEGTHRLAPKHATLFHVFFDINRGLQSSIMSDRQTVTEIGMLVKNSDLPRYSVDTKIYNSYNRPNIVQSKIKFDPVTIVFHDDNMNVVRNFWYDYYKFYYRDSDHSDGTYFAQYKYRPQDNGKFGYTRRKESLGENFLQSIRIYSLHQKRFSEYILLNPIIKSFKHGQHANSNDANILEHTMVIEYENILYSDGTTSVGDPKGFATLHYDNTPSPLKVSGGVKSLFGAGGLLDNAGSILGDLRGGNYLSAIFKAARTVNTYRNTNIKNLAINEVRGIVTREASNAIVGLINQNMRPQSGINVPTVTGVDGATSSRFGGLGSVASTVALAGAAVLLNSTPLTNKYRANPTTQANSRKNPPTNMVPNLPLIPNVTRPSTANSNLVTANNNNSTPDTSNQNQVDNSKQKLILDRAIDTSNRALQRLSNDATAAQQQVANTNQQLAALNSRLANVQTAPASPQKNELVRDINQQIAQSTSLNNIANQTLASKTAAIASEQARLNQLTAERNALNG